MQNDFCDSTDVDLLPRDAYAAHMHSAAYAMAWCLSVCLSQIGVLWKRNNGSIYVFFGTTVHPALFCKGIPIFLKIRVLSYGTLSQTLNLTTDFFMFFWPPRHVDHRSCFQQISTVDVLFITPTATITTGPPTHSLEGHTSNGRWHL